MDGLWPHNALPLLFGQDIFPTSAYKNGKADTAYLTHPKVVKAIQFHQDLTYKYKVSPTANFENYTGSISIPLDKSIDFITYFYALRDMQDMIMANPAFAGWLRADKQVYEIDNDNLIEIQLQVGSSKDYENINLRVFLADLDENVLDQVITERVAAVSPAELCNRSWEINLKDIIIEPGEYILKLEILDAHDSLIFTLTSSPVLIK